MNENIESVWTPPKNWTDGELARWIWFCLGNGLSLRVGKKDNRMTVEFDSERWKAFGHMKASFVHLQESHMVSKINQDPQNFSRVASVVPFKCYRENTSSRYYGLSM